MNIEELAKQEYLTSVAERQIAAFRADKKQQQDIQQKIADRKALFDQTFGEDVRLFLEEKCSGEWQFNYSPSLVCTIGSKSISIYFTHENIWQWIEVAEHTYSRFYGDFRQCILQRIGRLLIEKAN